MRVLKSGAPMLQSTARATLRLARTSNRYTHATRLMATQQVESTTSKWDSSILWLINALPTIFILFYFTF